LGKGGALILINMNKGFTLLEIIVAVAILSVGIVGSLGLINRTIVLGGAVSKQLIGAYLAQEGMEVIHNIRHTNWIEDGIPALSPVDWDDGISADGNYCVNYDTTKANIVQPPNCDASSSWELFIVEDLDKKSYVHAGPIGTVFKRHINITHLNDDNGTPLDLNDDEIYMLVKSFVEWDTGSIQAEGRLYDWK